jgi:hypothetical protein
LSNINVEKVIDDFKNVPTKRRLVLWNMSYTLIIL